MHEQRTADNSAPIPRESLTSVLGVVYAHRKTSDGGDLYLTQFGLPLAPLLQLENWYEKEWFEQQRVRLQGTSTVYRVATREVAGRSIRLVVKNCRVGEDVPLDTHTFLEFVNAEFNSPWEEFSLVMDLREGGHGPAELRIRTQEPLAIYVPPERMQLWQSGRAHWRIDRIKALHPGIDLDILRQYKLIYRWIEGENLVDTCKQIGLQGESLEANLRAMTAKVIEDMAVKGFVVADMKCSHIIIDEPRVADVIAADTPAAADRADRQLAELNGLLAAGDYSVVDYELLLLTPQYEQEVKQSRRHCYLDDQRDRFVPTPLPPHLHAVEIMGVPYVHGHVGSTGGQLWVVGRNADLFDYFLPERWRKTAAWKLIENGDEYYTVTKDNIHIIWKTSRVGEVPALGEFGERSRRAAEMGFNSPFEEFAIAQSLSDAGLPTVNMRAIYSTGVDKVEESTDLRRYESHGHICHRSGRPVLDRSRNYICIRGYYNGPDTWVAQQQGELCRRIGLVAAVGNGLITREKSEWLLARVCARMHAIGFDGALLTGHDLLLTIDPANELVRDADGQPEARICNFELIRRL